MLNLHDRPQMCDAGDTVAQMVAVHLARAHSVQSRPRAAPAALTVPHQRMRHLIEFIEV